MPITMGSLFARQPRLKERVYSEPVSVGETFNFKLLYNDVPAVLMHKRGNGPWLCIPINNEFVAERVPRNSDVRVSAVVSGSEKVLYHMSY